MTNFAAFGRDRSSAAWVPAFHRRVRERSRSGRARQAANVGGDLPDLIVRNFSTERRHPIRPPLHDRSKNLLRIAAVNPLVIHQRRPDPSAAVEMTADAIHRRVELLAFADRVRAIFVVIFRAGGVGPPPGCRSLIDATVNFSAAGGWTRKPRSSRLQLVRQKHKARAVACAVLSAPVRADNDARHSPLRQRTLQHSRRRERTLQRCICFYRFILLRPLVSAVRPPAGRRIHRGWHRSLCVCVRGSRRSHRATACPLCARPSRC